MSIYGEVVGALTGDAEFKLLYEALSTGDRETLCLLLDNENSLATTVGGSANANFWHCLAEYGWMTEMDQTTVEGMPPILQYGLTDRGYRAIPVLLCLRLDLFPLTWAEHGIG